MPTVFAGNKSLRKRARRGLDKEVFQKAVLFGDLVFLASSQKNSKKEILIKLCVS